MPPCCSPLERAPRAVSASILTALLRLLPRHHHNFGEVWEWLRCGHFGGDVVCVRLLVGAGRRYLRARHVMTPDPPTRANSAVPSPAVAAHDLGRLALPNGSGWLGGRLGGRL